MPNLPKILFGVLPVVVAALVLIAPVRLHAEFYKYVDENGRLNFVDDLSEIPPEYREGLTVYKEKYDHLSHEQKSQKLEKEKRLSEEKRRQRAVEEQMSRHQKILENKRRQQAAEEQTPTSHQTRVSIDGNRVLVPVTLGYRSNEVESMLLLDTGASITTLHHPVARKLAIAHYKRADARVLGGKMVSFKIAKINYIKIGPYKLQNPYVGVVKYKGDAVGHDGLLGMDFLRNVQYSIDFNNQVINWNP